MPLTTDSIREAVVSLYPDNLRNEISAKDMRDGMRLVADVIDAQPADSFWSVITEAQFVEIQDARADVAADAAQVEADRLATEAARDEVLAASQVLRAQFVTVGGQTFYPAGVGGVPAAIIEDGHILFGASPFGPLTYGVDYSVDGGIQFTFDPGEGSLFHLVTMPRFTNSEAQVILQDYKDRMVGRHPLDFGAVLDGVADDTDAIRALHDWCNLNGVPPSYRGVSVFAIQADAEIQINTSVDFCGAKIKFLNGIVAAPVFTDMTNAFHFTDPARPVQSGTVAVTDANLARGSKTPTADFWTQPGYVYMAGADLLTSPLIVNRQTDTPLTYRQSFKVIKAGVVFIRWPGPWLVRGLSITERGLTVIADGLGFQTSILTRPHSITAMFSKSNAIR